MDDEREAEDAIRALDRTDFGRHGRRLRVEWTKQERGDRRSGSGRRSSTNSRPVKTLFVINFDPVNTKTRDLERHFEPYGKVLNIRIRRNFAFIQFESQEDATKALEATNSSKLMDRVISVEYAVRDDDERRNGYSHDRGGQDRSPERRGRGRSSSPYGRAERASPDYGRGSSPHSKTDRRTSPDYGRGSSPHSKTERRTSPNYGRGSSSYGKTERRTSPYSKPEQRGSPKYVRPESPAYERDRSRSPARPTHSPARHSRSPARHSRSPARHSCSPARQSRSPAGRERS